MPVSPAIRIRVAGYTDDYARKRYFLLMDRYTWDDTSQELQALADRLGVKLQWSRFIVSEGEWRKLDTETN